MPALIEDDCNALFFLCNSVLGDTQGRMWFEPVGRKLELRLAVSAIGGPAMQVEMHAGWMDFEFLALVRGQSVYRATGWRMERNEPQHPQCVALTVSGFRRAAPDTTLSASASVADSMEVLHV